jgi:NADPH:quinone reductase
MRAAWYEQQGAPRDVLTVGEMEEPQPRAGEVRIRLAFSGVNPGDVKKRQNAFEIGMPYARIIPHSDGAGSIDCVGDDVAREWIGRRVWCYGAQTYRPFGTAAEYTVVPLEQAVPLPQGVPLEQGACLGIPGITAHRAVHVGRRLKEAPSWSMGVQAQQAFVQFNSHIKPGHESSRPSVLKVMRKSSRVQARMRSS